MDREQISRFQLATLIMGFLFGVLINPAAAARQDAWIAFIIAWCIGIGIIIFYSYLAKLNPGQTLIEMLKTNFGNLIGSGIGLLYIWYFLHLAAIVIRNLGEFAVINIYPETPLAFIIISLAVVIAYSLRNGLEVVARSAELLVVIIPILVLMVSLLLFLEFDWNNFKPILEEGWAPVIIAIKELVSFPFAELVVFLMVFPALNRQKDLIKTSVLSVFFIGIILLIITARDLLVLGPDLFYRNIFPAVLTAKLIPFGNLDPLVVVNSMIGNGLKATVCVYAAVKGLVQIFDLKEYKPFVLPMMVLLVALSIWLYESVLETIGWSIKNYFLFAFPFQFIFPVLIMVVSIVKKYRRK